MKRYAKLLVVPVAFLAMAGVKAADTNYTVQINGDTINYTGLTTTNGIAGTYKYNLEDLTTTSVDGASVPATVASPAGAYATCTMEVTKAYVAPVMCTKGESYVAGTNTSAECYTATEANRVQNSTEDSDVEKTPAVNGTARCTITNITIPAGTASDAMAVLLFSNANHEANYTVTMGDYAKVTVANSKSVTLKSIALGKYSSLTVEGTLRGDVKTAGEYKNNGGSYSGTITYETVGAPTAPGTSAVADNKVTLTITNIPGARSYSIYRATSVDGSYSLIKSDVEASNGLTTEYVDKTLENGKSYWYKVAAKGANSKLSDKSAASAKVSNGVAAPETLTVKAASYNSATITAGKVSGATGYLFYRADSTAPTAWKLVKTQSSNVFTDKDLTPGLEYYYTVAAYVTVNSVKNYSKTFGDADFGADNAEMGNETVTKTLTVDTQRKAVTTKLDKPSISKIAESSTSGKLKVTINKVTGATGYVVFNNGVETCRTEGTTCTTTVVTIGNLNTFTVVAYKGAAPAANFTHTALTALEGKGVSALSAEKTYTLKPGTPKISTSAVKLLEEGELGYYNTLVVTVTKFEVAGGEEVEYVLYKSTKKNGSYSKVDVAPVAADDTVLRKFVVTDLKPGKTYYFKAKVKVNGSLSEASNVVSKATNMTPYTKNTDVIKKLTAVADGNKKITLTLTDNTEGATGYAIYRSTKSSGTYKLVKTILVDDVDNPAEITYTNKKLTVGQKYYYKVRAFKTVDGKKVYGKYSSKVSATATLEAPTELELSDATKKTITLAWEKVSGANGYRVYNSDDELVATTTKASATIKGLDSNTEYTFYVRAYANVNGKKKLGAKSENFNASTEAAE